LYAVKYTFEIQKLYKRIFRKFLDILKMIQQGRTQSELFSSKDSDEGILMPSVGDVYVQYNLHDKEHIKKEEEEEGSEIQVKLEHENVNHKRKRKLSPKRKEKTPREAGGWKIIQVNFKSTKAYLTMRRCRPNTTKEAKILGFDPNSLCTLFSLDNVRTEKHIEDVFRPHCHGEIVKVESREKRNEIKSKFILKDFSSEVLDCIMQVLDRTYFYKQESHRLQEEVARLIQANRYLNSELKMARICQEKLRNSKLRKKRPNIPAELLPKQYESPSPPHSSSRSSSASRSPSPKKKTMKLSKASTMSTSENSMDFEASEHFKKLFVKSLEQPDSFCSVNFPLTHQN
jgi:hypothetical protein